MKTDWLALAIGNSRLHWAWFHADRLCRAWDTPHLSETAIAQLGNSHFNFKQILNHSDLPKDLQLPLWERSPELWLTSVVPAQTALWQSVANGHLVTAKDIPLQGTYSTLGSDRALVLWGAMFRWGAPALVIDGGTALTFTAADEQGRLTGGAILPGLRLQLRSLAQHTAMLPDLTAHLSPELPERWATQTPEAIASGVVYTLLAGIQDFIQRWQKDFPTGAIALTGGDGALLFRYLQQINPTLTHHLTFDPHLLFWGIAAVREGIALNQ